MATVIRREDVPLLETPGLNHTGGVATPSRGATEVSVIRQRQLPGGGNPPHSHDREEVVVVVAGRIRVTVAAEEVEVGPGDAVIVPADTRHRIANSGDGAAEWLLVAPAGVGFFGETGVKADPSWAR